MCVCVRACVRACVCVCVCVGRECLLECFDAKIVYAHKMLLFFLGHLNKG